MRMRVHKIKPVRVSRGFTLFELMVVLVIGSLMSAVLVFGFDQTLNRRKDAAAEELLQWLRAAADTAVFQSTVLGVTQEQDQLILLAFYQDSWYRLADQESLLLNEEISIKWSDSLIANRAENLDLFNDDDVDWSPYLVIMPTGEVVPDGEITIFDRDEVNRAILVWETEDQFEIQWQASS